MALSKILENSITDGVVSSAKLKDFTAAVDLNGVELILDADQDTSITADTDDRIDFKIANTDHISIGTSSGDTVIKPMTDAKDIIFQQYDGNKILEINDGNYVGIGGNAAGAGEIRIYEDTDDGTHYTGFKAGNNTESIAYTLPTADAASSGQALVSNASGVLSWATISANTPTSADGQALGSASLEWSDLFLADGGTIQFGNDQDVTLTHVADTGLLLNSTMQLQFNDASQYINAPSATVLDINATDEIELNATAIDINGTLDVSQAANFQTKITADAGIDIDNITIDGTEIDLSLGDLLIDVAGDIHLDADGADVVFLDGGTHMGTLKMANSNINLDSQVVDKDIIFSGNDGGSAITALTLDMSAAGAATFNNDVTAFSDARLKENVETIDNALDKVCAMRGVTFNRIDNENGERQMGVIAQEIQDIVPEVVKVNDDEDNTLSVSYGNLVGVLIESIKELKSEIDELKGN